MFTLIASHPQYCSTALSQLINQRVPLIDPEDGKNLIIISTGNLWQIIIIDDVKVQQEPHLKKQTLFPIKNSMDQKTMQRLVKQDPSNINSSYVISVFCEDHFKPMIDEYVKKVIVCGKSSKNYEKMNEIEERVKQLRKIFYYESQSHNYNDKFNSNICLRSKEIHSPSQGDQGWTKE